MGYGGCGAGFGLGADGQPLPFPMGKPVTITLTVDSGGGLAQLSVYQQVPLAEYVFPPRPATVVAPPTNGAGLGQILAASSKVGANGAATVNVVLGANTQLILGTSAPGQLEVLVEGIRLTTTTSWGWASGSFVVFLAPDELARHGIKARAGQTVQFTVQASRFAVAGWVVTKLA